MLRQFMVALSILFCTAVPVLAQSAAPSDASSAMPNPGSPSILPDLSSAPAGMISVPNGTSSFQIGPILEGGPLAGTTSATPAPSPAPTSSASAPASGNTTSPFNPDCALAGTSGQFDNSFDDIGC
jgi:hypothetical protein